MSVNVSVSRQWLRAVSVAMLVLLVFSLLTNLVLRKSGMKKTSSDFAVSFDPTLEIDYYSRYGSLSRDFQTSTLEKDVSDLAQRSLFTRYRPSEDFFDLVDIRLEPLALIYKGRIEQRDGSLIAQVNWADRTYFVKEGESIDGWHIQTISSGQLTVQNKEGEILTLPYLQTTYRKERIAVIYNGYKHEDTTVLEGGIIAGYTVSAITENSVTLSGKETFTLKLVGTGEATNLSSVESKTSVNESATHRSATQTG